MAFCSCSCTLLDPAAGLALGRREARSSAVPSRAGRFSAMNGHGPWLPGSSCTQTYYVAGYGASAWGGASPGIG